jgi:hypothetical protein
LFPEFFNVVRVAKHDVTILIAEHANLFLSSAGMELKVVGATLLQKIFKRLFVFAHINQNKLQVQRLLDALGKLSYLGSLLGISTEEVRELFLLSCHHFY